MKSLSSSHFRPPHTHTPKTIFPKVSVSSVVCTENECFVCVFMCLRVRFHSSIYYFRNFTQNSTCKFKSIKNENQTCLMLFIHTLFCFGTLWFGSVKLFVSMCTWNAKTNKCSTVHQSGRVRIMTFGSKTCKLAISIYPYQQWTKWKNTKTHKEREMSSYILVFA